MLKNISIIVVIAVLLTGLIIFAGNLVLTGSPALALFPVSIILLGVMLYIKKYSK